MVELNRNKVKAYFMGKSQTGPLILAIIGIITVAFVVGIVLLIGALIWYLYNKFSADLSGEAEVDKTSAYEIEQAKRRAYSKLNVVAEQIQNVEPVVVSGRGFEPESPTTQAINTTKIGRLFKRSALKKSDDPIYMVRIGSDNRFRCSLASITVFMFGETQLYIYYSNVDLTTGLVYSEGTHEYFYSDINAISFMQDREKVYNFKKKKFERILFESVKVFASGCYYTASLSTDLEHSVVEKEFTGMRNLIRDKKNAINANK